MPRGFDRSQVFDTAPEVRARQLRLYREMSARRKLELIEDANRTARVLALTGIKARFPEAGPEELKIRLCHLTYGSELATAAYGPLPEHEAIE